MEQKRTWLLPESGNLYKANLHVHSTVSDGKFTPEELKEMYMQRGYHAIAYTDHQTCVPHPELTDENFVALTGVEIAFGIGGKTSVHACGIMRDPLAELHIPNEISDDLEVINAGISLLREKNCITTLNHPRWSGMSYETLSKITDVDNIEVLNGFELVQDGYGDSSACFELELRRGRKVRPLATDDSHTTSAPDKPGYEYFQGFTMIKSESLTYENLIRALESGAFYASTGPLIYNMWLEGKTLHIECSPACGVYVHGELYSHRAAVIHGTDSIETVDIDMEKFLENSSFFFVQVVDTMGKRAWSSPHWLK